MTEKILGKIDFAEYGQVRDYPFLFGLHLRFKLGDGTSIGCGSRYTVNLSKECRWEESERLGAVTASVEKVNQILKDAKCHYVSELLNKPVEVTIENNTFVDVRILTEVL